MSSDFSPEQKRYLEGFLSGLQAVRGARATPAQAATAAPSGPDKSHFEAQDRTVATGGKLAAWPQIKADYAADGCRPFSPEAVHNVTRGLTSCLTLAFDLFDEVLISPHLDDGTRTGHWCAPALLSGLVARERVVGRTAKPQARHGA